MNDPVLVCRFEGFCNLSGYLQRFVKGKGAVYETVRQCRPFDELEYQRPHPRLPRACRRVRFLEAVDGPDMWMIERSEYVRLSSEASKTVGIEREGIRKNLQRDVPSQNRVMGTIDLAHSTGTDVGGDFVRAETGARCERHGRETARIIGGIPRR